ncbi:hypothetical protein TEQG_02505 [Trichophyton equinum CBS 127.97]|uniref:Uncharacterized protein n=1 Tax=Trichophyton equinum (strain ATCC MYA-4606 / CBS 127.97) TaxID=559882 RepID=F2PNK6_TRIEC|nr:hypothetical protein TEQG_02505 [Trichophyton equinum CBS 127.97]
MNQPRYYDDATPWGTIFAESKPSRFRMAQGAVFLPLRLHGDIDTLNSSSTVYCVKMIILTLGHSLLLDRPGNQPIVPALSLRTRQSTTISDANLEPISEHMSVSLPEGSCVYYAVLFMLELLRGEQ